MKIPVEYTPEQLRALIDSDFASPHYGEAVALSERALQIEEGPGGLLEHIADYEDAERV